jgi:hypothetical protein
VWYARTDLRVGKHQKILQHVPCVNSKGMIPSDKVWTLIGVPLLYYMNAITWPDANCPTVCCDEGST